MEFWQFLAFTEVDQLTELARIAKEVGFTGVLLGDHVLFPEKLDSPYPYSPDGQPGFDSAEEEKVIRPDFRRPRPQPSVQQQAQMKAPQQPQAQPAIQPVMQEVPAQAEIQRVAVGGGRAEPVLPLNRFPEQPVSRQQLVELDIPTFIRRQMD